MLRLAFQGEVPSRHGLMATFRMGEKWIRAWLEAGTNPLEVVLLGGDGKLRGRGLVVAVEYKQLNHVSDEELRFDCNQPGRSWESLYYELVSVYQSCAEPERNQNVDPTSYVSVVYFVRK